MRTSKPSDKRVAFTLVELLIVIAIIGILVSLLSTAIYTVVIRGRDAHNASEIGQLVTSLGNFKQKFGFYPPSLIHLVESGAISYSPTAPAAGTAYDLYVYPQGTVISGLSVGNQPRNPVDYNSVAALKQMWPRLAWNTSPGFNWSGNTSPTYTGSYYLQGDQCLVFFLGGIPNTVAPGTLGFSNNPLDPTKFVANQTTIGPFFTFTTNRLAKLHTFGTPAQVSPFYSYLDVYGRNTDPTSKPYAYFSSLRGVKNEYNPYYGNLYPYNTAHQVSDCNSIGAMPYCSPPGLGAPTGSKAPPGPFLNPDTFQLISAGADKQFGSNISQGYVIWNAGVNPPVFTLTWPSSSSSTPTPNHGMDDRVNFCPNILAAGNAEN